MQDVHAKLDWASTRDAEMGRIFKDVARPGGGDKRPYGIRFHEQAKPAGLVIAKFFSDVDMPGEVALLAADLVHNTRTALDHVVARLKECFGGNPMRADSRCA